MNSSTQVLKSAKWRGEGVDKGKHENGLELAETRVVDSWASRRGLILPVQALVYFNWQKQVGAWTRTGIILAIWALVHSNWQNRDRGGWFCRTKVEVLPRRGRHSGGWPDNSGETKLRWWVVRQEQEDSVLHRAEQGFPAKMPPI